MTKDAIGRYQLISEIGRGGMAAVYLADDPIFHRKVAIKLMSGNLAGNLATRARFEREAQVIAAIEHPSIVPVYDFGEHDGQLFLVLRYMAGGTLADRIRKSPLTLAAATSILALLAPALDAVHTHGVIHRDLKPANILFDQFGNPAIADFGIAHLNEATSELTGSAVLGTPSYMSPEQVGAKDKLDGRSDIYALGIILYEMLSGRTPFKADTPISTAMKHIAAPIPFIRPIRPDLPDQVENVMQKALAKDRDKRYSKASELVAALSAIPMGSTTEKIELVQSAQEAPTEIDLSGDARQVESKHPDFDGVVLQTWERPLASHPPSHVPTHEGRSSWSLAKIAGVLGIGLVVLLFCLFLGGVSLWSVSWITSRVIVRPTALPVDTAIPEQAADAFSTPNSTITNSPGTSKAGLVDDFSSSSSGWPSDHSDIGEYGYWSGGYAIKVNKTDSFLWVTNDQVYENSSIEVDSTLLTPLGKGYYGLLCRITGDNFYYFVIRQDGFYTIGKYKSGEFGSLLTGGWTQSDAILPNGQPNRIRVVCDGSRLRLDINDTFVNQAFDSDFKSGESGLAAASLGNQSFEVFFDNFGVTTHQ